MKFYAPLKISENMYKTPEGFLVCVDVPIARTGEMIYAKGETPLEVGADGKILITRDEAEVFNPKTIASFQGKSITVRHPEEFVNAQNWKHVTVGTIQNVRRGKGDDSNSLLADLLITDAIGIGLVEQGLREVSCGYEADYIQLAPGKGEQRGIIGNHLALVEQGRAGSSYAIKDHKTEGVGMGNKIADKIKSIFARAADEAAKVTDEGEDKPEKKEEKAKDEGAYCMDDVVKMVKDLQTMVGNLAVAKKSGDEPADKKEEKKEEKSGDEGEAPASLEDRLTKLEMAVAKMLEAESAEAAVIGDEDKEKSEDEDKEDKSATSDEVAKAEILCPGLKPSKDLKVVALKKAYETKSGKKVIDQITGGKTPVWDSASAVEMLFNAASEIIKASRTDELSSTKHAHSTDSKVVRPTTADQMNEFNAKHYGLK